ncbi:DNA ligase [Schizosaccharomyces cryophilus OY26]|uniref:DNA ligase n=1 Tax=Schizosaccharomyces cryophilus (strain OY26 / ATCC MYA-4695 / CBS 11777 / NBRC 106824 / NRRL Y48691) TaxID=653667 RepID=S9XKN4_SCHCR|nr:DNA ligase [Schizosaccharomyces cryophilus OY26]EPY54276.1 DNA ligase [Schizosaccharomyces cryophilus OY26]
MPPKKRANGCSQASPKTSKRKPVIQSNFTIQELFSRHRPTISNSQKLVASAKSDEDRCDISDDDYNIALKLQREFDEEVADLEDTRKTDAFNNNTDVSYLPKDEPQNESSSTLMKEANSTATENITMPNISYQETYFVDKDIFEQNPLLYEEYCRQRVSIKGESDAPYSFLANTFVLISMTRSRIRIVTLLTNCILSLLHLDKESLLSAVWLSTNDIAPSFYGKNLGVGPAMYSKALKEVCGISSQSLKNLWNHHGDPGDVAFEAKVSVRTLFQPQPLTIKKVYSTLLKIADCIGNGAQNRKLELTKFLLISAKSEEVRYIGRSIMQNLRIGAVQNTMLTALSKAFVIYSDYERIVKLGTEDLQNEFQKAEEAIKQSFYQVPDYNILVQTLLSTGLRSLTQRMSIRPGTPVKPMLGSITKDLQEMLQKMGGHNFCCEFKYDGQRAQVHKSRSGEIKIYSRHLEEISERYPDVIDSCQIAQKSTADYIIEGELVAIDLRTGQILDFQTLSTRERKKVNLNEITVHVCFFIFDLMYYEGESLLQCPLSIRRNKINEAFNMVPNRFQFVASLESKEESVIQEFFNLAISSKCEGLMVKVLDGIDSRLPSTYEPDKRGEGWIKVKQDYSEEFESLDLVPIGAWYGNGRKAGWFSPILLAVFNPENAVYEAVCKCMSGFSDQFYKELTDRYSLDSGNSSLEPLSSIYEVGKVQPQIFFTPKEVWEIKGAQITSSPVYKAAIGLTDEDRGLSIRFPRFIKIRSDKGPEDASTNTMLAEMFTKQNQ